MCKLQSAVAYSCTWDQFGFSFFFLTKSFFLHNVEKLSLNILFSVESEKFLGLGNCGVKLWLVCSKFFTGFSLEIYEKYSLNFTTEIIYSSPLFKTSRASLESIK